MADFKLTPTLPLNGYSKEFDGITVSEVIDRAIISIATPKGGEDALKKSITSSFKINMPEVGQSYPTPFANGRLLGMQTGQLFILFDNVGDDAVAVITKKLKDSAYLTNQSDSWAMIKLSGQNSRKALERICPIDLHPAQFPPGKIARTKMEHLGVIIICEEPDSYLLMFPRSSAGSFLHAIETSIRNIQ